MKFSIRFKIGNRFGAASKYTLRDFCISIADRCAASCGHLAGSGSRIN